MATSATHAATPYPRDILAGLRWRIRLYIWLEGLAWVVIWLGATFWISLGLDYLPVLVGASEMPAAARGVLLLGTAAVLAYLLYTFILRRTFVRLADRSMALLLERKFTFGESLVTAVEMSQEPEHAASFSRDMLARTSDLAFATVDQVSYGRVINYSRLLQRVVLAILVGLSVVAFWGTNREAFATAANRLYWLSDEPWPRSAHIEIVEIDVLHAPLPGQATPRPQSVKFENGVVKVARGSNVQLKVRADLAPRASIVPQQCTLYYREVDAADGGRGKRGNVAISNYRDTDEHRNFWFENKPFKGVLSTIEFDVLGYDHRLSGYRLEVVDSPAVVETLLDLTYPEYMVDETISNYLPVTGQAYLPAGTFIPIGTEVTIRFRSSKPLVKAEILAASTGERTTIEIPKDGSGDQFTYKIPELTASETLEVSLVDIDNVATEHPFRVFLTGVEDQPPQIEVSLKGIGSAVTPDVIIPIQGKVSDDYAIDSSWYDVQINDSGDPVRLPLTLGKGGSVDGSIDFRAQRSEPEGMKLAAGDRLFLSVKANDKYALGSSPHTGEGERYGIDVVTPDQLLAALEVREIGLRRRFELILDEMTQMRDSLLRVKSSLAGDSSPIDPAELRGDEDESAPLTPEQRAQREADLRLLRLQRGIQQSQKSLQEILGVAAGFLDIREELINNRVDTEDRKNRLKEQIADPLNRTCQEGFPLLESRLAAAEKLLREGGASVDRSAAAPVADQAIEQANAVLIELEEVLAKMQDLETYNELLEIVRELLNDQQKLIDRTQQEQKRQLIEELK
ncbi:MAG: hypothetical protein MUF06_02170 [Pirellulaceae bacterium]|nr:hypothetical protein [Pirellulaceae bacterium]